MLLNEYEIEFMFRKIRNIRNLGNVYIRGNQRIRGPHIVMSRKSRTDAQNGLDFHFFTVLLRVSGWILSALQSFKHFFFKVLLFSEKEGKAQAVFLKYCDLGPFVQVSCQHIKSPFPPSGYDVTSFYLG
jgi:hypothetical protein